MEDPGKGYLVQLNVNNKGTQAMTIFPARAAHERAMKGQTNGITSQDL